MIGTTIANLFDETKSLAGDFYREAKFQYHVRGRSNHEPAASFDLPLEDDYVVVSDKGVYLLDGDGLTRTLQGSICGIAFHEDTVSLTVLAPRRSVVFRAEKTSLLNGGEPYRFEEIYRFPIKSSNQRIHQLAMTDECVWAANTGKNCLTRIDSVTGEVAHHFPFVDRFGNPIEGDNNHINSVTVCGDAILFVAYHAGDNSLIGLTDGENVVGFPYENPGVHDIQVRGEDVYFSDTFGAYGTERPDAGGDLVKNGEPVDPEAFASGDGYIVRAIAGEPGRTVVGHSHKGDRQNRFDGPGAILVLEDDNVVAEVETPFAQVYDIVRTDGRCFETPPAIGGFDELFDRLSEVLGSPNYKADIAVERE